MSGIGLVGMLVSMLLCLYFDVMSNGRPVYLLSCLLWAVMLALSFTSSFKQHSIYYVYGQITTCFLYSTLASMSYTINIGTILPLIMIIAACVFTGNFLVFAGIFAVTSVLYSILAFIFKPHVLAVFDSIHANMFMITAIFLHRSFSRSKINAILHDIQKNEMLLNLAVMHTTYVARTERDEIRGIFNRSTFVEQAQNVLSQAREQDVYVFAMLDIDFFKNVNDTYGHMTGDTLLREMGVVLANNLSANELKGRLGGDEFAYLCRAQTEAEALNRAWKILDSFTRAGLKLGIVTHASLGMSMAPVHGNSFEELYEKADRALYAAKEAGRNCAGLDYSHAPESGRSEIKTA